MKMVKHNIETNEWVIHNYHTMPSRRKYFTVNSFHNKFITICRGKNDKEKLDKRMEIFDTRTNIWNTINTYMIQPRHKYASVMVNYSLFIEGGFDLPTPQLPTISAV